MLGPASDASSETGSSKAECTYDFWDTAGVLPGCRATSARMCLARQVSEPCWLHARRVSARAWAMPYRVRTSWVCEVLAIRVVADLAQLLVHVLGPHCAGHAVVAPQSSPGW